MPIRAIVFDLDDTLLVDMRTVEAAFVRTATRAEPHGADVKELATIIREEARRIWRAAPTVELARGLGIASWEGLCSTFVGGHEVTTPFREWAPAYRLEAWSAGLAAQGIDDRALARDLAEAFVTDRREQFELYPGAAELVHQLRAAGYLVGLLTNGPNDLQRDKIRMTGIEDAFDAVVISGEAGVGKPDPAVFQVVLDALGVEAGDAVMVGDNPNRDISGGRAVGMRAIWVDVHDLGRPEGMEADAETHDVRHVSAIVDAWREVDAG